MKETASQEPQNTFDYRDVLKTELAKRKALSPKYSLRDFAKDIGISPSLLSYVLSGKKGLSRKSAQKVATALTLTNIIGRYFCLLVASINGRSRRVRNAAKQGLKSSPTYQGKEILRPENRDYSTISLFIGWKLVASQRFTKNCQTYKHIFKCDNF